MKLKSLDFFYSHFAEEQMNLLYTGDFSDELTDRLIEINSLQFNSHDEFKTLQRRSAFLIAECFQNIVRHSDLSNKDSYFHIKNTSSFFSVISGNSIQKTQVEGLQNQLEQLNKLTSEELRDVYRKTLVDGEFSNKGGAGLGLVEMARRTKNKLSFSFSDINAIKSYFYLQLLLNTNHATPAAIEGNFDNNIFLREVMLEENIFLVYKGIISTPLTVSILGIIEYTLESLSQKVVFIKLMGFLEKIHAVSIALDPHCTTMLLVGENAEKYHVGTSCMLDKMLAISLQRNLKFYQSLNQERLDQEHKLLLKAGNQDKQNDYNLFFIELIKNSLEIEFEIRSYNASISLINLVVGFQKKRKSQVILKKGSQKEIETTTSSFQKT